MWQNLVSLKDDYAIEAWMQLQVEVEEEKVKF